MVTWPTNVENTLRLIWIIDIIVVYNSIFNQHNYLYWNRDHGDLASCEFGFSRPSSGKNGFRSSGLDQTGHLWKFLQWLDSQPTQLFWRVTDNLGLQVAVPGAAIKFQKDDIGSLKLTIYFQFWIKTLDPVNIQIDGTVPSGNFT